MSSTSDLARELGAIAIGNTFLRTMDPAAGRVFEVEWIDDGRVDLPGYGWSTVETLQDSTSGWRRVPTGYVVPSAPDLLAGVVRLLEAYWAMCADPETGRNGIDATAREMAAMAGMEVPT